MWSTVDGGGATDGRAAPCSRGKHSATLLGGHVYVLGGRGAGGAVPLRDFWRYSLATGTWERLESRGDAPPALQEHSATAHGSKLYIFGGEAGSSHETPLWIYDTETGTWRKLPGQSSFPRRRSPRDSRAAGPRGRRGHSAHSLKDCLLVYGGYQDLKGSTNELWAFHYESESWQAVRTHGTAPARHRHAAVLHDNRLYVHGGQSDLRTCGDLWYLDTLSRHWRQVRTPPKLSPAARCGHAGLRAGTHLYIFGGEVVGAPGNELWRFHFGTETWERISPSQRWPSPRVDCAALLVPAPPPAARPSGAPALRPPRPASLLREISKLSTLHLRRAARCSYSMLDAEQDSTESLVRHEHLLSKSHSAYIIEHAGDSSPREADDSSPREAGDSSPREADEAERSHADMSREPISVPDFADMVLPTPVLSPVEATKLVYLDSEEEEDMRREMESFRRDSKYSSERRDDPPITVVAIPKSASVRFTKIPVTSREEDEAEMSTSDYASAEKVNRLSGTSSLGFSNPHYLGPDVRNLGAALTPDSGVAPGDIELQDMSQKRATRAPRRPDSQLHILLIGGKEPPHLALFHSPLSMWTYRLL